MVKDASYILLGYSPQYIECKQLNRDGASTLPFQSAEKFVFMQSTNRVLLVTSLLSPCGWETARVEGYADRGFASGRLTVVARRECWS